MSNTRNHLRKSIHIYTVINTIINCVNQTVTKYDDYFLIHRYHYQKFHSWMVSKIVTDRNTITNQLSIPYNMFSRFVIVSFVIVF